MNTNKVLAGMALMAGMSGMMGCASIMTTEKPVLEEKKEIVVKDGKTSTNTTATVEMKSEYNYVGKTLNAVEGTLLGVVGGVWAGHKLGTETNGMENATFWDKTCNYVTGMGKGIYHGVTIGTEYGWKRSKVEEEKMAKEAAIRKYEAEKVKSL